MNLRTIPPYCRFITLAKICVVTRNTSSEFSVILLRCVQVSKIDFCKTNKMAKAKDSLKCCKSIPKFWLPKSIFAIVERMFG